MSAVDDVKGRLDILDVVSHYVQLQRSGRSHKAVCPFHSERTPSFFVFPERQSWRCFGACATGGDVFSFIMKVENLDFKEALTRLAQQAGVQLEDRRGRDRGDATIYQANEAALEMFRELLASKRTGVQARAYLEKRGLSLETIGTFQLGMSPGDGASLKGHLASKGYTQEQLALAGLVTQGKDGGYRDLFRGRLIFPIHDRDGRLAGFGGRALGDAVPKYLNSPRSPVFDKSRILYAAHLAKEAAREKGVVIVEGYMDAIAAHQHGFTNVVASMGTALTEQQVALVHGLLGRGGSAPAQRVVLALDPDVAGQEATLRSMESSWKVFQARAISRTRGATLYDRHEAFSLMVASLPRGKDPDELIREAPAEWEALIEGAVPLMDYLFTALSSRLDLTAPEGKKQMAELLAPLIYGTHDAFQQDHYFQRLSSLLGVSEEALQASLGRLRAAGSQRRTPTARGKGAQQAAASPFSRMDHDPLEEQALALLLQHPELVSNGDTPAPGEDEEPLGTAGLRLEHFRRVENREVFTNLLKCSKLDVLKEELDDEIAGHLDRLLSKIMPPSDRKERGEELRYCVRRLEERHLRDMNREEGLRLSEDDPADYLEQGERILEINERLRDVLTEQGAGPLP